MTSSFLPNTQGQSTGVHGLSTECPCEETLGGMPCHHDFAAHLEAVALDAPYDAHLSIEVEDWDVLFEAVKTTLQRIVGERLGELPEVPAHSAELSASLVQAVVLDCVSSLDRLHDALKQERSQRPTP